jgi:hypothetical protein
MIRLNKVLLLLLVFQLQILTATNGEKNNLVRIDFNRERAKNIYSKHSLYQGKPGVEAGEIARRVLEKNSNASGFNSEQYTFQLIHSLRSPAGTHITFRPTIKDIPVYGSDVTVTVDRSNHVVYISPVNRPFYSIDLNNLRLTSVNAIDIIKNYLHIEGELLFAPQSELMIFNSMTYGPSPVYRVKLVALTPFGDWEAFIHAKTGEILQVRDRMRFQTYSNGKGMIYKPDPLTRMQTEYGGPYRDNDNSDTPELTAARDTVILKDLYFNGVEYQLRGPFCLVADIEPPVDVPPKFPAPDLFNFTRSQPGFEAVMVYYHIDRCFRRLQQLGFEIPALHEFKVDAHGFSGADNSHFSPTGNYCAFGEGGVDDAEDADVIWHEYTHAIQYHVTGDMLYEGETMALVEGSADYWAASYSRSVSTYNWQYIYNWDGHNEFWEGRVCDKEWHYPEDVQSLLYDSREYEAGQLWSSVLMNIWSDLGRDISDRLFIQTHYLWGLDPGFQDAAESFVIADSLLYSGTHLATILYWFDRYGLIDINEYLPRIEHTPLNDDEQTQGPFIVETVITPGKSSLDYQRLYVYWRYGAGPLDSVLLVQGDEPNVYTAEFNGSDQAGWIHYYLSVSDLGGNEVTAPPGAPAGYYSFYAGPDTIKPEVTYVSLVDQRLSTWPPLIRLKATDNMAISTAEVMYYINQPQKSGSFLLDEIEPNMIYSKPFTIAKESLQAGDSIFYRITVSDRALHTNRKVVPGAGYYSFKIKEGGISVIYQFEDSNGGFSATGDWSWGLPTTGPEIVHSGQNCWATNLHGRYSNESLLSSLIIPEVDLGGYLNVSFSFYHWYETDKGNDGGNVKISSDGGGNWSLLYPVSGYAGILSTSPLTGEEAFSGSSKEWRFCQFDLTSFRDQKVRVKFDFAADDTIVFQGWYIDDVLINDSPVLPPVKSVYAASGYENGIPISWYLPDPRPMSKNIFENDNALSLVGYNIFRRSTVTGAYDSLSAFYNPERMSYLDSSAVVNHPYSYRVTALYMDGESTYSNSSSAISARSSSVEIANFTTSEITMLSVANNGNIGYTVSDDGDSILGQGMIVNGKNVLKEGSFLIGSSAQLLSDAAYNEQGILQGDFMPQMPVINSMQDNWTRTRMVFNDGYAYQPLGFQVIQNVFSRAGDKFIIWTADIINCSSMAFSNLVMGFYFDWQLDSGEYGNTINAVWNGELLDAGYLTDEKQTVGIVLLSHFNFHAFRILDNDSETDRSHMTKSDKWFYLNNSYIPEDQNLRDRSQIFSIALSDYSKTLFDGDSLSFAFALIAAEDVSDFAEQCGLAFQAYTELGYQRSGLIISMEEKNNNLPAEYTLSQNYPNPFNPSTTINYQLPTASKVELSVYNLLGQKTATLVSGKQPAGYYRILWDGKNEFGRTVASGVYFYKIEAGSYVKVCKMLFLK